MNLRFPIGDFRFKLPGMEPDNFAEFEILMGKLAAIGWVERVAGGREFKDVRFTGSGVAGLKNVHALETALGGLTPAQADLLFFVARELATDKPETN
jgi:hypothetical protein